MKSIPVQTGTITIDLVRQNPYDLIFLDENMPGLSGMDTLKHIKQIRSDLPVVMVTKSDEEDIMAAAIGSDIADYLIKPVKPKQVLLTIMKILDQRTARDGKKPPSTTGRSLTALQGLFHPLQHQPDGRIYTGRSYSGSSSLKSHPTRECQRS